MDYFKRCKLKLIEWKSQSPDLNVTENLWVDLKTDEHIVELEAICTEE